MQYSQEHLKTMVYAKFGGQTECIMGNWKIENTVILLLCTVYSTFLLCLQFCFPFLLSESRFCRFSLNFASLVFYFSEKVVVNVPDLAFNQT